MSFLLRQPENGQRASAADDHDENCDDDNDDFDEDDNAILQTEFMVIHRLIGSKMVCAHLLERLSIALQDPTKYSLISYTSVSIWI